MLKPRRQFRRESRFDIRKNEPGRIQAADVNPVLVAKGSELHAQEVSDGDHLDRLAQNGLELRVKGAGRQPDDSDGLNPVNVDIVLSMNRS